MDEKAAKRDELLSVARRRESERNIKGAIADYDALLENEPGNPDFLLERGRLRMILGENANARVDFLAGAAARPEDPKAMYYVAYSHAHSNPTEALEDYRAAAKARPRDAEGYYYRGLAHLALNDLRQAHADFAEAVRSSADEDPRRELYEEKAAETEPYSIIRAIRNAPLTWAIAALNVAVMVAFRELLTDPSVDDLMRRGAVERYSVRDGESWRLLTAIFLHIGAFHLIWNTWAGIAFCTPVEKALGSWRFLLVYLACGVGASAVSVIGHHVVGAGSSGALFGIDGVLVVLLYQQRRRKRFLGRKLRRLLWSMGVWFVIGMVANFDNWAHGGGLLFGLIFGALVLSPLSPRTRRIGWGAALIFWIATLAVAVAGPSDPKQRLDKALYKEMEDARARGDFPAAERILSEAINKGRDEAWIRVNRGSIRHLQGNLTGAHEDYVAVVKTSEEPNALFGLGSLEAANDRHEKAVSYFDRALAVTPDSPDVLYARSISFQGLGRKEQALLDVRRALRLAPIGWAYRSAAEELQRSLSR